MIILKALARHPVATVRHANKMRRLMREAAELNAQSQKAGECEHHELRFAAMAFLAEESVRLVARVADASLDYADACGEELPESAREALVDVIGMAVDWPDWYRPGARVVLPGEDQGR